MRGPQIQSIARIAVIRGAVRTTSVPSLPGDGLSKPERAAPGQLHWTVLSSEPIAGPSGGGPEQPG